MSSNPIQTHFVILCAHLDVDEVLPYLKAERMVTTEEYETLINDKIPLKQKRERLLIMMPRKGSDYFKNFGNCLVWSGQTELARHIGVDVSAVPKCPHKQDLTPVDPFQKLSSLMTPGGSLPPGISAPLSQSLPSTPSGNAAYSHMRSQPDISQYREQWRAQQGYQYGQGYALRPTPGPPNSSADPPPPAYSAHPSRHQYPPPPLGIPSSSSAPRQPLQPSSVPQPPEDVSDGPPPKVFILYHKDPHLQQSHHITAQEFADYVRDLADILHSVGGFELSIDIYETADIGNWSVWTEEKVKESSYVLLVCSPGLLVALRNFREQSTPVQMQRGSFSAGSVSNLLDPSKFIPVFLKNYENLEWIPSSSFRSSPSYTLNVDEFTHAIDLPEGTSEQVYHQKIADVIQMQQFEEWGRLIRHLRKTRDVPPPSANPPIPVPAHPHMAETWGHASNHSPANPNITGGRFPLEAQSGSSNSGTNISEWEFLQIAQRVSSNWLQLGIRLGLPYHSLHSLSQRKTNPQDATMEMFGMWQRQRGSEATRSALKNALCNLGYGNIASRIFPND